MKITLRIAVLLLTATAAATADNHRNRPKATPVIVHQRVNTGCELVRSAQLLQYSDYASLAINNVIGEIYSPELSPNDFVELASFNGKTSKGASRAGFIVKAATSAGGTLTDLPRVVSLAPDNGCPSVQEASASAEKQRESRRADLQARMYRPGHDEVTPPIPESTPQPKSDSQTGAANASTTSPSVKPKVMNGTVVLAIVIGVDGGVKDAKVARSLDPVLDAKAIEEVRHWRFQPARKKGLPVPAPASVEVSFHLH